MIVETRSFYRGKQKSTGLEVIVFGMHTLPAGDIVFIGADIEGHAIRIPLDDFQLNWRYDAEHDRWQDLDLAVEKDDD